MVLLEKCTGSQPYILSVGRPSTHEYIHQTPAYLFRNISFRAHVSLALKSLLLQLLVMLSHGGNKDGRLRSVPAPTPTPTPDQHLDSDSDSDSSCQKIDDSDSGSDSSYFDSGSGSSYFDSDSS